MGFTIVSRASSLVAVPLVLHDLGSRLYSVWVLAGSLIMIQTLVDLGMGAAVVRFTATATASGSRRAVLVIVRHALVFYLALSVLIGVPLWVFAGPLTGAVPALTTSQHTAAVAIVRWAAVAFVITNATAVLAAALQGADRVAASYRDQTVGWLAYLPLLAGGFLLTTGPNAVGVAWAGAFTLQLVLLIMSFVRAVRAIPNRGAGAPPVRELISLGARWQVSSWADFATFQLPRFVAAIGLGANQTVAIDVSMRAAQLVVAPLLAFFPTVLPKSSALLSTEGLAGLRRFLQPLYSRGALLVLWVTALALPLELPLLQIWTGSHAPYSPLIPAAILIGNAAHASTGLFTSAELARGSIRSVVNYKLAQLLGATVLIAVGSTLGVTALACALSVALLVPALGFNFAVRRSLSLRPFLSTPQIAIGVISNLTVVVGVPLAVVWSLTSDLRSAALLGVSILSALITAVGANAVMRHFGLGYRAILASAPLRPGPPPLELTTSGENDADSERRPGGVTLGARRT